MEIRYSHQLIEKRAASRYSVALLVEFEHGGGWTHDISITGACIETDQQLACGFAIRFFLHQPDPQGWGIRVQCRGLVVRAEQTLDGWRVGVMMEGIRFEG